MLCESLNDVLTPLIHRRETAEKDTHDTSVSFLAVRSHCLSAGIVTDEKKKKIFGTTTSAHMLYKHANISIFMIQISAILFDYVTGFKITSVALGTE